MGPARVRIRLGSLTAILAFAMIAASLALAWWLFSSQISATVQRIQGERVENIAMVLADTQEVRTALGAEPIVYSAHSPLQRHIDTLRAALGVDFIVVIDPGSMRLTHADSTRIGHHFRGDDEHRALAGAHYVSVAEGTLGVSVRGFAPVHNAGGEVIGAVSVGVTQSRLAPLRAESRKTLLLWLAAVLLLGGGGSAWLAARIKHRLMGMEPDDIARLVAERRAMLDAMHEGVIALDDTHRVTLINPAAQALLASAGAAPIGLGDRLTGVAAQAADVKPNRPGPAHPQTDIALNLGGRPFLGSYRRMTGASATEGAAPGAVITFRDTRAVQALAEELTGVRRYAQALRAATHEFKNKLHVMLGLTQIGETDALEAYLRDLVDHRDAVSASIVEQLREPVLAGFLLAKQSEAREQGIALVLSADTVVPAAERSADVHALVSIIGNLLENAFEAVAGCQAPTVDLQMAFDGGILSLTVQDNGIGMDEATIDNSLRQGFSSKGDQRGVGLHLVSQQLDAVGGRLALYSTPGQGTLVEAEYPYTAGSDCS